MTTPAELDDERGPETIPAHSLVQLRGVSRSSDAPATVRSATAPPGIDIGTAHERCTTLATMMENTDLLRSLLEADAPRQAFDALERLASDIKRLEESFAPVPSCGPCRGRASPRRCG